MGGLVGWNPIWSGILSFLHFDENKSELILPYQKSFSMNNSKALYDFVFFERDFAKSQIRTATKFVNYPDPLFHALKHWTKDNLVPWCIN